MGKKEFVNTALKSTTKYWRIVFIELHHTEAAERNLCMEGTLRALCAVCRCTVEMFMHQECSGL
jgi:hypothetical protein